jgi:hypothetical protein
MITLVVSAIGHIYEEPAGVVNFTAKLAEFLPPYTRHFSKPGELFQELQDLPSDAQNQAQELFSSRRLAALRGDPKTWARILLHGPEEPVFRVRFTVFYELEGPVLALCPDRPFMAAGFSGKAGARFETVAQLVVALNCVGLPAWEICALTNKVYSVTRPQLRMLTLGIPSRLDD